MKVTLVNNEPDVLLMNSLISFKAMKHVVTFGSPFVSCGGEKILEELGLDERHVHCVMMMHRDIVPRAFSCNYPDFVALILKLLNGSFHARLLVSTKTSLRTFTYQSALHV